MKKEFVMRGQTESGKTEVLNFSGVKPGMAYKMTEFTLYPSTSIGTASNEMTGSVTAGKTAQAPTDIDFNDEGLIATTVSAAGTTGSNITTHTVVNDTYLITQNLILMVQETGGSSNPINWQCKFERVKMGKSEEAVTNYKQFMISDGS